MHIALISHEYPPYIFGGIGSFAKNLACGLSKCGVTVTVLSGYPTSGVHSKKNGLYKEIDNGVTVLRYPYPNLPPRHTIFQLANFKTLAKCIENLNADVIHGQSGSIFPLLPYLKGVAPIIVTFHSSPKVEKMISCYSINRGGSFRDFWTYVVSYPIWAYTFRKELYNSNLAIAVSESLVSELLDEMGNSNKNMIQEIHNGIDIEMLDREYGIIDENEESNKTILFAGRLYWRKGALNLIKLAYLLQKKNSQYRIIVHGEGPLLDGIKNRIRELELSNIELKGFTSRTELVRSMRKSRFIFVPSFYEACPMILLESMCLGKIPLTLDLPFSREFTDNGRYGLLSNTISGIADKLSTLMTESDIDDFSNRIKQFARIKYDIKKVSIQYLNSYKSLC
jgi:glycosyltransferase involved in cell wall biosynthesis